MEEYKQYWEAYIQRADDAKERFTKFRDHPAVREILQNKNLKQVDKDLIQVPRFATYKSPEKDEQYREEPYTKEKIETFYKEEKVFREQEKKRKREKRKAEQVERNKQRAKRIKT